uniref:Uncharacterized protein n=1 Tax=Trypanosoma congolense (strain IL3000) TaxID=1068625 RepID=G0US47_TRYCI|nr:conserved hypothetical protein [Trypanosoma congolense IL3000]
MYNVSDQSQRVNRKAAAVKWTNLSCAMFGLPAVIVLMASWIASMLKGHATFVRYVVCAASIPFVLIATTLSVFQYCRKMRFTMYLLNQLFSLIAATLIAVSLGMTEATLQSCSFNTTLVEEDDADCSLHKVQALVEGIVCFFMSMNFFFTQQCIILFVNRGILDGIKQHTIYVLPGKD